MRVFVYTKTKKSELVAQINNVTCVQHFDIVNKINVIDSDSNLYTFDTTKVKTRIYQN